MEENMKKQGKKNRIFAGIAAAVMAVSATAVGMRSYSANAAVAAIFAVFL